MSVHFPCINEARVVYTCHVLGAWYANGQVKATRNASLLIKMHHAHKANPTILVSTNRRRPYRVTLGYVHVHGVSCMIPVHARFYLYWKVFHNITCTLNSHTLSQYVSYSVVRKPMPEQSSGIGFYQ